MVRRYRCLLALLVLAVLSASPAVAQKGLTKKEKEAKIKALEGLIQGVRHGLRPPTPPASPLLRSPIARQEVAARLTHFNRTILVDLFYGIGFAGSGHLGVASLPP